MSPIWQEDAPCWSVRCDNCGEALEHYDTQAAVIDELTYIGWYFPKGEAECYCTLCTAEMFQSMRALREAWLE